MLPMDLTGATVIVAKPGDALTFVIEHEMPPWDGDQMLAALHEMFPDNKVNIVSSCQAVIHEPKPE